MAAETVVSEIGLFVSSRCNFNTSILDHMKELKNNAFVGAVFRFSIMMGCVRRSTRPQVLYWQQHLHKRL